MTNSFLKGQMQIHQSFWPAGFPGALTDTPFSYDPEKAKQILDRRGRAAADHVTLDMITARPSPTWRSRSRRPSPRPASTSRSSPGTGAQVITKYRERTHQAMLLYWGPDFMDPHSNAKAFAYNADNSDDAYAATTTWRNAWTVPEELNVKTMAALVRAGSGEAQGDVSRASEDDAGRGRPSSSCSRRSSRWRWTTRVQGYVNGATSDFVFYRLVEKN